MGTPLRTTSKNHLKTYEDTVLQTEKKMEDGVQSSEVNYKRDASHLSCKNLMRHLRFQLMAQSILPS